MIKNSHRILYGLIRKTNDQSTLVKNPAILSVTNFKKNCFHFCQSPKNNMGINEGKLNAYFRLCRFDKPIGAMLLFWPTAWGVLAGASGIPSPYLLGLFLMGSWTSRSAGCIVNDYLDRDFDKKVQRTQSRPLATGQVTTKQAGGLLFLNLTGGLFVLFHLPLPALAFTLGIVGLAALYPLAKRYTNYPQLVLGVGFNSGILIAALTANVNIPLAPIMLLYGSGICWTMVYDTVYAYQDIQDDLKIGIKSTAIQWMKNPKQILEKWCWGLVMCHGSLTIFDVDYFFPSLIMITLDLFLIREIRQIRLDNRQACGLFFRKNNLYGAGIFLCLLFLNYIRYTQNCRSPK